MFSTPFGSPILTTAHHSSPGRHGVRDNPDDLDICIHQQTDPEDLGPRSAVHSHREENR